MVGEIKIKKKNLLFGIGVISIIVLLLIGFNLFGLNSTTSKKEIPSETMTLEEKFAVLSKTNTNSCGGGESYVAQLSVDGTRIQGSCCYSMNFHRYAEQIEELKKYSDYKIIPSDPYDVSSEWADKMIKYGGEKELTLEQQTLYDEAMGLSHEGGPCCCKCWHWYAYEGLAKHLIVEENFTVEQIAEIWDLSDACGGKGHGGEHD